MKTKDHPGEVVRARHLDFINANKILLFVLAYENYLKKGRGIVVVCDEDYIYKPKGIITQLRIAYFLEAELFNSNTIGDKEKQWLSEYDPDSTVLIGFMRVDAGGWSGYRIQGIGKNTPVGVYIRSKPNDHSDKDSTKPSNVG